MNDTAHDMIYIGALIGIGTLAIIGVASIFSSLSGGDAAETGTDRPQCAIYGPGDALYANVSGPACGDLISECRGRVGCAVVDRAVRLQVSPESVFN